MALDPSSLSGGGLEKFIWELPADAGTDGLRPEFLEGWAAREMTPASAFSTLTEETLALAFQKEFFADEAFGELFGKRVPRRLLPCFIEWGLSPHQALDIMQDLSVRFLDGAVLRYDPTRSFYPYVLTAARNLVADFRRRRQPESLGGEIDGGSAGPDEQASAHELEERIGQALQTLPDLERRIVELILAGCDSNSIAGQLGIPLPRVYRLTHQARERLRQLLGGGGATEK